MKEYKYKINGNEYSVAIIDLEGDKAAVEVNGVSYQVDILTEGYTAPAPRPAAKPAAAPAPAPVQVQQNLTRNVFFLINSAKVRPSEIVKVNEVVNYLKQNPSAKVSITGYADRGTGNAVINSRLSKQRANAVFAELVKRNIAANRIIKDAKGDTVQPFAVNDQNRVVICIAE